MRTVQPVRTMRRNPYHTSLLLSRLAKSSSQIRQAYQAFVVVVLVYEETVLHATGGQVCTRLAFSEEFGIVLSLETDRESDEIIHGQLQRDLAHASGAKQALGG